MSKVKVVKKASKEDMHSFKELGQMFEKIAGVHGRAEPDVVGPKIAAAYNFVAGWLRTLKVFVESKLVQMVQIYDTELPHIEEFITAAVAELEIDINHKYVVSDMFPEIEFYQAQLNGDVEAVSRIEEKLFAKYTALKDSTTVMNIVNTVAQLTPYAGSLFAAAALEESRISHYSRYHPANREGPVPNGDIRFLNSVESLKPLYFAPVIDFKFIWMNGQMDKTRRKFLLDFLFNIYYRGTTLFDLLISPDVDVAKLSQLFMDAIHSMKKRLSGYDRAFALIESAADTLAKRFNVYYRNSQRNGSNPAVFFEDFAIDFAKSIQGEDPIASSQLKKLAAKMRDLTMQTAEYQRDDTLQKLVNIMGPILGDAH